MSTITTHRRPRRITRPRLVVAGIAFLLAAAREPRSVTNVPAEYT